MDILNQELFYGFTVLQMGGGVLGLLVLSFFFWPKKKPEDPGDKYRVEVTCFGCGWAGKVSSHTRRCPSCNDTIVQQ